MTTIRTVFALALLLASVGRATAQDVPWLVVRDVDARPIALVAPQTIESPEAFDFARDSVWAAKRVPGAWIQFLLSRNSVWRTTKQVSFLFENYDCSGPALLESPAIADEARKALVFDMWVYWPASSGTSHLVHARGVPVADPDSCRGTYLESRICCMVLEEGQERLAAAATGFFVAQLGLRPPFRLEAATFSAEAAAIDGPSPKH